MTVRRLTCCCCGNDAGRWEQWWNRDTGYGLCAPCGAWIGAKETPEEMNRLYGLEGVHRPYAAQAVLA